MFLSFSNCFCITMSQTWTIHTVIITPDYLHLLRQEMHWCFTGQREVFALEIRVCFMLCQKWLFQPWWISVSWSHFHPKCCITMFVRQTFSQISPDVSTLPISHHICDCMASSGLSSSHLHSLNLDSKYEWSH